jgi:lambda family phage holin
MPEKNPDLWVSFLAWLGSVSVILYPPAMSVAMAVLRVVYGGGTRRQMFLEGSLCGLCTLSCVPLLEWVGLPGSMATFAGGAIGFMGVERLRIYASAYLDARVNK